MYSKRDLLRVAAKAVTKGLTLEGLSISKQGQGNPKIETYCVIQ
jgi:hypothetical protein